MNDTMHWISGWSYALNELAKQPKKSGDTVGICLPTHGYVESRVLFKILNDKFKGRRITVDQASAALWDGAIKYYSCNS